MLPLKDLGLALILFNSVQCDRQKPVIVFLSGAFPKMGAETEQEETRLANGIKILMEVGVYFGKEIQSIIYCGQADSLVCTDNIYCFSEF